jgi:hypothetical protein
MLNLISKVYAVSPIPTDGCNPGQEDGINLADCLKLSDSTPVSERYDSVSFLVNLLVRNIFVVAGVVLFLMFFVAGFQFIAKGKEGAGEARQISTAAILGFVIMFSAYWIIQLVQYITGVNILI